MAFEIVTRTFNLSDYLGDNYDPRSVTIRVSTNLETGYITDTVSGEIRTGLGEVTIGDDGAVSIAIPKPDATLNPSTWQTRINVDHPAYRGNDRVSFWLGPFTITSSGLLSDLVTEQVVPPTYVGAAIESVVQAGIDAVEDVNTAGAAQVALVEAEGTEQVTAVETEGTTQIAAVEAAGEGTIVAAQNYRDQAFTYRNEAEGFRDECEDLIITDLGTTEGQMNTLIGSSDVVQAALDARTMALAPVLPGPLEDVSVVTATAAVIPSEVFDDYLWGFKGNEIHRSSDGTSWTLISTVTAPGVGSTALVALLKCDDGQVLAAYEKEIYRSSNWSGGGAITWTKVLDMHPTGTYSWMLRWGIDGDGTRFIATEYGAGAGGEGTDDSGGFTDSRYIWFSDDQGVTWSVIYDDTIDNPTEVEYSHQHGVCVDPWAGGRLWHIQGHRNSRGVYWSDDDGATWTAVPEPAFALPGVDPETDDYDWPPTTLTATPRGIIMGTDSPAGGVWIIRRRTNTADMEIEWLWAFDGLSSGGGLNWFADRGWYDPATGLTWIGFSARDGDLPPIAVVTDGVSGQIVYTGYTTQQTDRVRSIVVYKGVAHMKLILTTGSWLATGTVSRGTIINQVDVGRVLGGAQTAADRTGVAVGPGSQAAFRSVAVGDGALATGSSSTIAIGHSTTALGTNATSVGQAATAAGSAGSAYGQGATSSGSNSAALGKGAQATSASSTATGATAAATGTSSTATGHGSVASASTSTATGKSAAASTTNSTATGANSVASGSLSTATGAGSQATGSTTTAVGYLANASNTSALSVGGNSAASGSTSTAVGTTSVASNTSATALGSTATASGLRSLALGRASQATTSDAVAIGESSVASHSNAVALGAQTVTTGSAQVSMGAKHLALLELAADPSAPVANGARFYAKDNGAGKTQLCVRFNTGAVVVIATEP